MKFSEIEEIDQAHKKIMDIWRERVRSHADGAYMMSYARFKVLKAVCEGKKFSPDIAIESNLDATTVSELLLKLREKGLLKRALVTTRTFGWAPTDNGKTIYEVLMKAFADTNELAKEIPFGISGTPRP